MQLFSTDVSRAATARLARNLLCLSGLVPAAHAQSFQGIGDLAGGLFESASYGVSADGSTVVGYSQSAAGTEAVRWRETGLISLGDLVGGPVESSAVGANYDGSILVGGGRDATVQRAVRWDGAVLSLLPQAGGHAGYASCLGISSNGRTLTGFNSNGTSSSYTSIVAVRIDDGVLTPLPYASTNDSACYGQPSEDGRVVSGRVRLGGSGYQACYWTDAVRTMLPQLPGGPSFSFCYAISGDGSVQVGGSCSLASPTFGLGESCRWKNGVAQSLGALPGAAKQGVARSCNRDGSIVVGEAMSTAGLRAYIWDATNGMRELGAVLASDYGLNLAGWTLTSANAITPDGRVVVGVGINPSGHKEGWIARLGCGGFASYCTAGTTTNGCTATLWAAGTPSASGTGSFTLSATSVEGQKQGLFFYSDGGAQAAPWGASTSLLCLKTPMQRMEPQNSGGTSGACSGSLASDWNAFISANPATLGAPFTAGDRFWAQAWFRDPLSAKATSLSNALSFVVCP